MAATIPAMRLRAFTVLAIAGVIAAGLFAFDVGGVERTFFGALSRPPADPVIDGWVVGTARPNEAAYVEVATELLARTSPGHADIVRVSLHNEGVYYDRDGGQILWTRSGSCCVVVLFELADGSKRAVGAGLPGISQTLMAFETGPVSDRLRPSDSP